MGELVLVTGALGNVGAATATALIARGVPVRVADINTDQLAERFPDADHARLDFLDASTFDPALEGCVSLFLLRPPPISRMKPTLNRLLDHAAARRLGHVVFSSVAGADTNRVVPHHRVETHLQASGLAWTILRPGFFAQNLVDAYAADIRDDDRLYLPAGTGRVAFIDALDIGAVAAHILADPQPHTGRGYTLTGPAAVTFDDVAGMLTDALGRRIRYEPATVLGYADHLRRRGLPVAQILVQTVLHVGLRRGDAEEVTDTVTELLGRPATPLGGVIAREAARWRRPS
jgi:uncharacterized protein YbjT (DUF2867 family)